MDFSQFQAQVQQVAREQRDAEMDKVSQKYATQMERLDTSLRRKSQELSMEKRELGDRRKEELFTTGEALLSLWQGRTNYTLSRMSRASRYRRQTKADLGESYEAISGLEQQMIDLEAEYQGVLQRINDKWAQIAVQSQDYVISPYKKDVNLELFGIGWVPYWVLLVNNQVVVLPAYHA
jgi:chromosome segregation ATPase